MARTPPIDPWSAEFAAEFGAFLSGSGVLVPDAVKRATRAARETGERFDFALTRLGLVSEGKLAEAAAAYLGLPFADGKAMPQVAVPVAGIDGSYLKRNGLLPLRDAEGELLVAVADPFTDEPSAALAFYLGRTVKRAIASAADISGALERLYRTPAADAPALDQDGAGEAAREEDTRRLAELASEAPVIRLVHDTIQRAVEAGASDIHIEPGDGSFVVRRRIDGDLERSATIPAELTAAVVSRIKILARLNIAEQRLPQDGRMRTNVRGRHVELRVSTVPTINGESVVLRILDREAITLDFGALGFSPGMLDTFFGLLDKPNGLILVTGPTGAGKSTTLYAALNRLNKPNRKTFTIEDPVETLLAGAAQVQVQPRIGLTFAHSLRSILRQDPNIIMVGEIRDLETAQMAMQAALTGHLVLSTLHTNSAPATLMRLADMGVEPYLVASTLRGALAQRLVRRICKDCSRPARPTPALLACAAQARDRAGGTVVVTDFSGLREPVGCPSCRNTGFRGRIALAELLVVDDTVARALVGDGGEAAIEAAAHRSGMTPMLVDGLEKVAEGLTTFDEVLRVSRGL